MNNFNFPEPWLEPLGEAFCRETLNQITIQLESLTKKNLVIFPPLQMIFQALDFVKYDDVKVLILGQDPYHGFGQANGLAFSVNSQTSLPPSLKNIFIELEADLNIPISTHGDLSKWATQGVLLLNASLTVEEGTPNSHRNIGWSKLTDKIISVLSDRGHIIFVLWGNFAQQKKYLIDADKNKILSASHPSPLSAYRGFFRCKHFSKINSLLLKREQKIIDWDLN